MVVVSLAEARDRINELLEDVERGAEVLITRDGAPDAAPGPDKVPLQSLEAFRASMPPLRKSSAELIREMHDEGY